MKTPNWVDMMVYRWFYKRWTPIFENRIDLLMLIRDSINDYIEKAKLTTTVDLEAYHAAKLAAIKELDNHR